MKIVVSRDDDAFQSSNDTFSDPVGPSRPTSMPNAYSFARLKL